MVLKVMAGEMNKSHLIELVLLLNYRDLCDRYLRKVIKQHNPSHYLDQRLRNMMLLFHLRASSL